MTPFDWIQKHWQWFAIGGVAVVLVLMGTNVLFSQLQHKKYVKAFEEVQILHTQVVHEVETYHQKVAESNQATAEKIAAIVTEADEKLAEMLSQLDTDFQSKLAEIDAKHDAFLELKLKELGNETDSLADDPDALYREFIDAFGLGGSP